MIRWWLSPFCLQYNRQVSNLARTPLRWPGLLHEPPARGERLVAILDVSIENLLEKMRRWNFVISPRSCCLQEQSDFVRFLWQDQPSFHGHTHNIIYFLSRGYMERSFDTTTNKTKTNKNKFEFHVLCQYCTNISKWCWGGDLVLPKYGSKGWNQFQITFYRPAILEP